MIKRGKASIILVPEISLTPQMVERFKGRFGRDVAVFHSKFLMVKDMMNGIELKMEKLKLL